MSSLCLNGNLSDSNHNITKMLKTDNQQEKLGAEAVENDVKLSTKGVLLRGC